MIFETHAHYDDEAFREDRDKLLKALPEKGIGRVVNVGASPESCQTTIELMEAYDFVYG
ncbi:MAG: TatD family hydrolase, partial [Lachnospiraceae bacterium]|nr:TatD family hydrolase [Lachnospiraceae bacterium]